MTVLELTDAFDMTYIAPPAATLKDLANSLNLTLAEPTIKLIHQLVSTGHGRKLAGGKRTGKCALDIMFQLFCYHFDVSPYERDAKNAVKREFALFQKKLEDAWVPEFRSQTEVLRGRFDHQIKNIQSALPALDARASVMQAPEVSRPAESGQPSRKPTDFRLAQHPPARAEVEKLLANLKKARTHWCAPPIEPLNELPESPVSDDPSILQQTESLKVLRGEIRRLNISVRNTADSQFLDASARIVAMSELQKVRREVRVAIRSSNSEMDVISSALGGLRSSICNALPAFVKEVTNEPIWTLGKPSGRTTRPDVCAGFVVFLSGLAAVAVNVEKEYPHPAYKSWYERACTPASVGKKKFAQSTDWLEQVGVLKTTWQAAGVVMPHTPSAQTQVNKLADSDHLLTLTAIAVLAFIPPTTTLSNTQHYSLSKWCGADHKQIISAAREHGRGKSDRLIVRPPELDAAITTATHALLDAVKKCEPAWWDVALSSKWLATPEAVDQGLTCPDEEYVIPRIHRDRFATDPNSLREEWKTVMAKRWRKATEPEGDSWRVGEGLAFLNDVAERLQGPSEDFVFKYHQLTENCHVTQLYGAERGDRFDALVRELNVAESDAACYARYLLLTPYCNASLKEREGGWFAELPGGKHFRKHLLTVTQKYTTFNKHHVAASP